MHGGHDLFPELRCGVAAGVDALGHVIARPDRRNIVRCAADEPAILIVAGAAGLTGDGHRPERGLAAGAVLNAVLHHVGHGVGGVWLEGLNGARCVIDNDVAVLVGDEGVGAAVGEDTVIHERAVGLSHLTHRKTVGQLAQRHGRIVAVLRNKARHAEARRQIIIRGLRPHGELIDYLRGDGVERVLQRRVYGDKAVVRVAVVIRVPARSLEGDVRRVAHERIGSYEPKVDRRAVGRDRLYRGAGGAVGPGGAVEAEVYRLLADAAAERQHLALERIHYDYRALKLLVAVRRLRYRREVAVDRVDTGLNVRIKAAVYLVAAVIEQCARGVLADALLLHEVLRDIVNDRLGVVGHYLLSIALVGGVGEDKLLFYGLTVLGIVDIALLVHLAQDRLLTLLIVLPVIEGVVIRRQIRDADDRGALGKRQIGNVLAEIGLRCGLYAEAALTEVHGVEVPFHDLLLVVLLLKLQRGEYLRELALDRDLFLTGQVLYELLGDGRAAVAALAAGEDRDERTGRAVPVNALVLIEALVLNRHQRLFHVPRDLVIIDPDAVLLAGERGELAPLTDGVLIPYRARLIELEVLKRKVEVRGQAGLYIIGKDAGEHHPRHKEDEQHRPRCLEHRADGGGDHINGYIRRFLCDAACFRGALLRFVFLAHWASAYLLLAGN